MHFICLLCLEFAMKIVLDKEGDAYEYKPINLGIIPVIIVIWTKLVAYGAMKEARIYEKELSRVPPPYPLTDIGAPPYPLTQSGAPSYPQTQVQTSPPEVLPHPQDPALPTFGAPRLPIFQQDTSKNQSTLTLNSYT